MINPMKKVLLLSFILFFFSVSNLSAFILRDSETENFIKELITPIAKAANQNTKNLKIIIIQNKDVNAFVTPGQRIFLFSGLRRPRGEPLAGAASQAPSVQPRQALNPYKTVHSLDILTKIRPLGS